MAALDQEVEVEGASTPPEPRRSPTWSPNNFKFSPGRGGLRCAAGVFAFCSCGEEGTEKVFLLLGLERFRQGWCYFYGRQEDTESPVQTTAREGYEESEHLLGHADLLAHLRIHEGAISARLHYRNAVTIPYLVNLGEMNLEERQAVVRRFQDLRSANVASPRRFKKGTGEMTALDWFETGFGEDGAVVYRGTRETRYPELREYVNHNLSSALRQLGVASTAALVALPQAVCILGDSNQDEERVAKDCSVAFDGLRITAEETHNATLNVHADVFVPMSSVSQPW